MIEVFRYNIRMFVVPIGGPADMFCDNQSVVTNVSIPSYFFNKEKTIFVITGFGKRIQLVRYELDGYQVSIIKLTLVRRQKSLQRDDTSY